MALVHGVAVLSRHLKLGAALEAAAKRAASEKSGRRFEVVMGAHPWFWVVSADGAKRLARFGFERA